MSDATTQTPASPGLPPVAPPSGRFILQLFLVPGMIVAVAVVVYLCFNWIFGAPRSPEKILRDLNDGNLEVRWRAAADLAQVLPRDQVLAANTGFALDLAAHLRRSLDENRASEKVRAELTRETGKDPPAVTKSLQAERDQIWYLIACLGNFQVPVGAPILQELALEQKGADAETVFRRRSQAVFALTVLGSNVKKVEKLPENRRSKILDDLKAESESSGERGRWAAAALGHLEGKKDGLSVGETLCKAALDPSPFLRKQAAGALTHWDGPHVEDTLLALAKDDGAGDDPIVFEPDQAAYRKDHPEEVRQQNARDIHYNAALTLARRGSAEALKFADLYKEMLDEQKQHELARADKSPQQSAGDARVVQTILAALNAMDQLRASVQDLPFLPASLDALADSDNKSIRSAAKELKAKLK